MSLMNIRNIIIDFFNKGNTRSLEAKKNIIYLLFAKGGTVFLSLLLVPLTIGYVESETYGVWLTLSSMVAWLSFFDIGLNNGLRNRLVVALAHNDIILARKYVSTAYAMLILIFIPLMIVLLFLAPLFNWYSILRISPNQTQGILTAISIIISYFCIQSIFNTINIILIADQRPADASFRAFIQQIVTLGIIYILTKTTNGSLVNLCISLCCSPIIIILLFNVTLFSRRYKTLCPSIKFVDFKKVPDLLKLGVQFFIIQIAGVIQFQLVNFLIIRNFGPSDVTSYNISFKYFSIIIMVWNILLTPIWSAVTDAIAKNEYNWIVNVKNKYFKIFLLFLIGGLAMLIFSSTFYKLWVGDVVNIPFSLSLWVFIYSMVSVFGSLYVSIMNGAGQLKVQTIASIFSPFVFILTTYLLINSGCGVQSIIIGSVLANFNGFLIAPIQCHRYLKRKVAINS